MRRLSVRMMYGARSVWISSWENAVAGQRNPISMAFSVARRLLSMNSSDGAGGSTAVTDAGNSETQREVATSAASEIGRSRSYCGAWAISQARKSAWDSQGFG